MAISWAHMPEMDRQMTMAIIIEKRILRMAIMFWIVFGQFMIMER